jgi:uncharacterized protein GlcG (DUF336 family)
LTKPCAQNKAKDNKMKVKRTLSLKTATQIIDKALAYAHDAGINPLCAVVTDGAGIPIAMQSEDGCGTLRFNVALAKAYGALGMGTSSRDLRDRMEDRPNFASAMAALSGGKFVPAPGGVLIVDAEGFAIGAVGISGDTSEKDEYCAISAIHEAGFGSAPETPDANWRG